MVFAGAQFVRPVLEGFVEERIGWSGMTFVLGAPLSYEPFRFDIIYAVMANQKCEMAIAKSSVVTGFA